MKLRYLTFTVLTFFWLLCAGCLSHVVKNTTDEYTTLEIDDQNRLYTSYQSSQSASGKGFYLLFGENGVFNDTILIADLPPEYVTRNSSQVITKGNGDIAMFYAEGDVRNDTAICDIFIKEGNIYNIIPVELTSFSAVVSNNAIGLNWETATETNNYGFEVYRFNQNSHNDWQRIGFIEGNGTTNERNKYSFIDDHLDPSIYKYKLKQMDFDGSFKYSDEVEAEINQLTDYALYQNYPNPFNPSTVIKFSVPEENTLVTLRVYSSLGEQVEILINQVVPAGQHQVHFDATGLPSGIYFYTLTAGNFVDSKKMVVLK